MEQGGILSILWGTIIISLGQTFSDLMNSEFLKNLHSRVETIEEAKEVLTEASAEDLTEASAEDLVGVEWEGTDSDSLD
jgi:hypothetical protein